jgi:hypothetical protein
MPRRFPPPWSIEEHQESFIVKDATGQQLAYVYFEDEPTAANVDEAAIARRGIPYRSEHRQAAKRAGADFEGHSEAAQFCEPGRLSAGVWAPLRSVGLKLS